MKKTLKNVMVLIATVAFFSFAGCSSSKKAVSSNAGTGTSASPKPVSTDNASYIGSWAFVVKGTPDGDSKGDMIISEDGGTIKGMISADGGQTEIQDLKINNNILTGVFNYNGMSVNMTGTFIGNAYEGKVEAQGYAFPMNATKN